MHLIWLVDLAVGSLVMRAVLYAAELTTPDSDD
jgi:hypothetical protein